MFYDKNRAKCLNCDDVIESTSSVDWVECSCGCLLIRGGSSFLARECEPGKFKELSVIKIPDELKFRDDTPTHGSPPLPPGFFRN
jgi:hypothetical protein